MINWINNLIGGYDLTDDEKDSLSELVKRAETAEGKVRELKERIKTTALFKRASSNANMEEHNGLMECIKSLEAKIKALEEEVRRLKDANN